jgi:hypothetical protein
MTVWIRWLQLLRVSRRFEVGLQVSGKVPRHGLYLPSMKRAGGFGKAKLQLSRTTHLIVYGNVLVYGVI